MIHTSSNVNWFWRVFQNHHRTEMVWFRLYSSSANLLEFTGLERLLGGHVARRLASRPGDGESITTAGTSSSELKYDVGQVQRDQFTGHALVGDRDGQEKFNTS